MKLRSIAVAACLATLAAGSAYALNPTDTAAIPAERQIRISGSSALRLSLAAYLQEICQAGTFDVYFDDAGTLGTFQTGVDGVNHRAYSCNLAVNVGSFTAGQSVVVYKRDLGGSGQGVAPIANNTDEAHLSIDGSCVANPANPSPATDIQVPTFLCPNAPLVAGVKSDAGISDVEPALLNAAVNLPTGSTPVPLGDLNVGSFVQGIFGVAVNKKLYRALQEAQGIIPAGAPLLEPANPDPTTWSAADIATIPSLTTEFVRSVLIGAVTGSASANRGWNIVVPASVDAAVSGKTVNICRRTEGSGTQASFNAYFANNPCGSGTASTATPLGVSGSSGGTNGTLSVRTGPQAVFEGTSTGQVETCLGTTVENATAGGSDSIAYGLGILGRENNPRANGGDRGYRYVKLDGKAPLRVFAKAGDYPMVYESTMQWNNTQVAPGSAKASFLAAIRSNAGRSSSLAAADVDTQQGVMAPPATYTGPYLALSNPAEVAFGSRVSRLTNNSCAPLRISK